MINLIRKILYRVFPIYWRVFKPKTYGVKCFLLDKSLESVLMVQHSYGNREVWNLPGGGYKPAKESPETAVAREIQEELSLEITVIAEIGVYYTEAQGKRDTVKIYLSSCSSIDQLSPNVEIDEWKWMSFSDLDSRRDLSAITRSAAAMYSKYIQNQHD